MRRCALSPDAVIAKRDIRRLEHTVWKLLRSENKYFLTRLEIGHACLLICDYLRARRHDDFLLAVLVRHGQCLTIDTRGLASHSGIGHCAIGQVPVREAFGRVHVRWEDEDRRCLLAAVGLWRSSYGQVRAFLYVGERRLIDPWNTSIRTPLQLTWS